VRSRCSPSKTPSSSRFRELHQKPELAVDMDFRSLLLLTKKVTMANLWLSAPFSARRTRTFASSDTSKMLRQIEACVLALLVSKSFDQSRLSSYAFLLSNLGIQNTPLYIPCSAVLCPL
jgi:hypothetical protein